MLPLLLGLGILGGNELLRQRREAERAQGIGALLGSATQPMGPPTEAGAMGVREGTGLLADPADPRRQMEFAAGIMAQPRNAELGATLLNAAFQRAQQGSQFERQEGRMGGQFTQELAQRQAEAAARASQWLQEFNASRTDAAQRLGFEGQRLGYEGRRLGFEERRLGMEGERLQIARDAELRAQQLADAKAEGPELPKLSPGWMYGPSAAGLVAMPVPGTPDYERVVAKQSTLAGAEQRIGRLVDMLSGEEKTVNGQKIRVGGAGTELWGEKAATYSTLRGQIISDVAALRDMGVLQAGELERIEDQLPDPTTLRSSAFRRTGSIAKSYEELRGQFAGKREALLRANPWLVPPLPPGARVIP